MLKKLLICGVSLMLVACLVFTGLQIVPMLSELDFDMGNHFEAEGKTYTLLIETTVGGTVSATEKTYPAGATVNVTATPNEGYIFTGWYSRTDAYLTTARAYVFQINENTVLKANFAQKPESMEGADNFLEELRNCKEDFSFSVRVDGDDAEAYLKENLQIVNTSLSVLIGTDYEEQAKDEIYPAFTVERIGDTNEYRITPTGAYSAGATYSASFKDNVEEEGGEEGGEEEGGETPAPAAPKAEIVVETQVANNGNLNFAIEKEEVEVIEYATGIVYLTPADIKASGADYVQLASRFGLGKDVIFCVYSGQKDANQQPILDENSYFGKVTAEQRVSGQYRFTYVTPTLIEIFAELEIYSSCNVNLEESGATLSTSAAEVIAYRLMADEGFQNYVAKAQQTLVNRLAGTDYQVELLNEKNLKDVVSVTVDPTLEGNQAKTNVTVTLNWTVRSAQGDPVAQAIFRVVINRVTELDSHINMQTKYGMLIYDVNNTLRNKDTVSADFYVTANVNGAFVQTLTTELVSEKVMEEFQKLTSNQKTDMETVQNIFRVHGYQTATDVETELFTVKTSHGYGLISETTVGFAFHFDLNAVMHYVSTAEQTITTGVRTAKKGFESYKTNSSKLSADEMLSVGTADIKVGVVTENLWNLANCTKIGTGAKAGIYTNISGFVNTMSGVYAGQAQMGNYFSSASFVEENGVREEEQKPEEKTEVFSYGYQKAMIAYEKQSDLQKKPTVQLNESEIDLFALALLQVKQVNMKTGMTETVSLSHQASDYKIEVSFLDGSYLTYAGGKLKLKGNAPDRFFDEITITVTSKDKNWNNGKGKDRLVSYLPTVTLAIDFGADNAMEAEFRKLYQNYNETNTKVLRDHFDHLLHEVIEIPENYAAIFDCIAVRYVDGLFDTIKEYKAQDDNKRTMEQRFVREEANAFRDTIGMMNELITNKSIEGIEVDDVLQLIETSNVLYKTLISAAYSEECAQLTERFAVVDQATKDEISNIIDEFEAEHSDSERVADLMDAFRNILGFDTESEA